MVYYSIDKRPDHEVQVERAQVWSQASDDEFKERQTLDVHIYVVIFQQHTAEHSERLEQRRSRLGSQLGQFLLDQFFDLDNRFDALRSVWKLQLID